MSLSPGKCLPRTVTLNPLNALFQQLGPWITMHGGILNMR